MKTSIIPLYVALVGLTAALPKHGSDDVSSTTSISSSSTKSKSSATSTSTTSTSTKSASASPTSSSKTTTSTAASTVTAECYYSPLASSTAYAASMPNPSLSEAVVRDYYNNYASNCQAGTKFAAYELGGSDHPWFGGILYGPGAPCSTSSFSSIVGAAMRYQNPQGNPGVTCLAYKGETDTRLQKEAKKYFKDLSKN